MKKRLSNDKSDELLKLVDKLELKKFRDKFELIENDEFRKEESFDKIGIGEYLSQLLDTHNLQPKDIIINLNMDRSYTYQILSGRRNPTRNFLLRIAIFLKLPLDETQRMLSIAQRAQLYPRNRFDAAIIFALEHEMTLEETNALLEEIGEELLN